MIKRLSCPICESECEYDYKSIWEGNRDLEDIHCPICDSVIDKIFTDQIPIIRVISKGQ